MNGKRWLAALALALALLVAVAACGGDDEAGRQTGQDTAPTTDTVPSFSTLEEGSLTVGSDIPFPPFEFREGDDLTGYDVELVEEIASRLGLEVKWVDAPFDTIFTQLAAGRFDMVASATTITEEREQQVNFTTPYYLAQQALTVNAERTPEIAAVEDLDDTHTVAVQSGTTGESWARENLEPAGVEIRSFPEAPDTYTALEAGSVTGVIFDEPSAVEEAKRRESLEVVQVLETGEEYGFGVDPQNEELLQAVNDALQELFDDGTYQTIYETWFPDAPAGSVLGT